MGFRALIVARTVELFKQLLWRQNRYAAYNTQVKARPSQGSFRVIDWTQDNHHQINRQKRSRPIHQIATDKEAMDQTPPSQQNKREKTSGPDHDIITDKRPVEQSPPSQQCSPALSLESPQTDAVALSPIESQPSQVQHTSILTTTQSKGRIKIPFHIALHSGGKTRQTFWEEGCFGSKSLKEFLPGFAAKLECEANDIERIKLALRLKTLEIEIEMDGRSEDIWEMATATFRYEVRRAQDKGEIDGVDVLVGPVMRKSDPEPGASEEEDREFDL